MTKSTNDSHETLGAKEMFNQSIMYLLNGYRGQGLTADEAKARVAKDIQSIYEQYADSGTLPPVSRHGLLNPERQIDSLLNEARLLKNIRTHADQTLQLKHRVDTILRGLQNLKTLIK